MNVVMVLILVSNGVTTLMERFDACAIVALHSTTMASPVEVNFFNITVISDGIGIWTVLHPVTINYFFVRFLLPN
jgi:hypothetical protein